jgi:CBS domain containing-hemolysin-like protein
MTGLITLEDAVETLLGVEIEDEIDNAEEIRAKILERWRSRIQDRASQRRHSETTKAS